ncbi:hypothetical protein MKZ38_006977 [Zalerion maritima]|uniref:Nudix hydrolase domain-containing protein n=1 Tax=Zalerion maritima TaxID=339359 RepID=A0AAD5WQ18_9PEZI|nr:hypothetical protein MKZ38_006977 [Zalerion maritima]
MASASPIPGLADSAGKVTDPRPSASVIVLSPTNEVLLLHRVQTSSAFASAHVFPGGNLDSQHDGSIPDVSSPSRHADGPAYRIAAVRECFEECGILLARPKSSSSSSPSQEESLIRLAPEVRDQKRKEIHSHKTKFMDFMTSIDAEPDVSSLIPFTRWITPMGVKKRFTTQMYLYLLPLTTAGAVEEEAILPTPDGDGGVEHTAATFAPAGTWLSKARRGEIILMPPQAYLLHLVHTLFHGPFDGLPYSRPLTDMQEQRARLLEWIDMTPTASGSSGKEGAMIPWKDKIMSPVMSFRRTYDKKVVLALDGVARELKERKGDPDRVVLVNFEKGDARQVEVRMRDQVVREEKEGDGEKSKI